MVITPFIIKERMQNFWSGFEKQANIGSAIRNIAAGAIKGTRSLGTAAIAKGSAMPSGSTIGKGLQTAGSFIRKNPKASMGIAGGTAALGASALSNKEK